MRGRDAALLYLLSLITFRHIDQSDRPAQLRRDRYSKIMSCRRNSSLKTRVHHADDVTRTTSRRRTVPRNRPRKTCSLASWISHQHVAQANSRAWETTASHAHRLMAVDYTIFLTQCCDKLGCLVPSSSEQGSYIIVTKLITVRDRSCLPLVDWLSRHRRSSHGGRKRHCARVLCKDIHCFGDEVGLSNRRLRLIPRWSLGGWRWRRLRSATHGLVWLGTVAHELAVRPAVQRRQLVQVFVHRVTEVLSERDQVFQTCRDDQCQYAPQQILKASTGSIHATLDPARLVAKSRLHSTLFGNCSWIAS